LANRLLRRRKLRAPQQLKQRYDPENRIRYPQSVQLPGLIKDRGFPHNSAHITSETRFIENMRLSSVLAFIFDIDGTLVDSNELHVDSWDRAFRRFGKQFPREQLRAQIGKGSDQYLPEFLTPEEIKRFGKDWMNTGPSYSEKNIFQRSDRFLKCTNFFSAFTTTSKRIVLASSGKKADTEYYSTCLRIGDLIDGCVSGDDADSSKPAPDIFAASLKSLAIFRLPTL
jgi:Predicted phosphatase/phosphohexomutase